MVNIEIKFKKVHNDAQLPCRKHDNREINAQEAENEKDWNIKLNLEHPGAASQGYKIQYHREPNTDIILGTGDTGYDVFSVVDAIIPAKNSAIVDTGIEIAYITPGYWFKIESR